MREIYSNYDDILSADVREMNGRKLYFGIIFFFLFFVYMLHKILTTYRALHKLSKTQPIPQKTLELNERRGMICLTFESIISADVIENLMINLFEYFREMDIHSCTRDPSEYFTIVDIHFPHEKSGGIFISETLEAMLDDDSFKADLPWFLHIYNNFDGESFLVLGFDENLCSCSDALKVLLRISRSSSVASRLFGNRNFFDPLTPFVR